MTQIRDFINPKLTRHRLHYCIVSIIGVSLIGIGILYILAHNWGYIIQPDQIDHILIAVDCMPDDRYVCLLKRDSQVWNETIALGIFFFSVGIAGWH